jgi:Tfp pilus assembly protein PilZ
MASSKEKRSEARVPVDLWIEAVPLDGQGELYYQRATNLSVGGAYFVQTVPMPVGTAVSLAFTLPGDDKEISCQGAIVTARDFGMGVQFTDLKAADRARVEKLIARAAAADAPKK